MTEPESGEEATLFPKTAGERLREARVRQNLSLADVAARTRIPMRHLEAIELGDYTGLPSPTYSVGFAKAYARAIGADEVTIGHDVRHEVENNPRVPEYQPYDTSDPRRLPPRGLASVLGIVAVLIVVALGVWYGTNWFRGDTPVEAPAVVAPTPAPAVPITAPTPAVPTGGQVVLTATDVVWLRVYDATGKTLFERELKPGEHYDVPPDANQPMINIGRADKLQVTVNGSAVAPLGTGERAIKDVPISAAALIARNQAATSAGPGAGAAGGPTATPATSRPIPAPTPAPTPTSTPAPGAGPTGE